VIKVVATEDDPVLSFFRDAFNDPTALEDTPPPGTPQPAIEAYVVDPPESEAEPDEIFEAELIADGEPGNDTPPPCGPDDQGRRVRPEAGGVTIAKASAAGR
jgi:hypothetical protein